MITTLSKLHYSSYQQILFSAMFTLAFFAFLRLGELAVQSVSKPQYVIQLRDIQLAPDHLLITLHTYKHSAQRPPVTIKVDGQAHPICPVQTLHSFLSMRGKAAGPLFCFPDLKPLTKSFVSSNLAIILKAAGLDPTNFKGHSFRIGAATYAASQGLSSLQIQQMGRWHSTAFQRYIRISTISASPSLPAEGTHHYAP